MPRHHMLLITLLLLVLPGCGAESSSPDAPPGGRSAPAPPPWETGWEPGWFYPAHLDLEGNERRWAHLAEAVGRTAPELQLSDWRFGKRRLAELRGKLVLLDFWATWCADCIENVPLANTLRKTLADEPFELIGVCAPKGAEDYAETIAATGLRYPTGLDRSGAMERAYAVPRWPYYVLLDTDGVIRATGLQPEHVQDAVRHLLAAERARGAL